jgi:dimethylargininase
MDGQPQFTRAVLRTPCAGFASGITTSDEGPPILARALEQHAAYARALQSLGLSLTILPADERYPDSTFVEDTAIVTPKGAVITRPGAPSRAGEPAAIEQALAQVFPRLDHIAMPGTVDGGDICETDDVILIGVTARTNEAGARQLAGLLAGFGYQAELVDIRGMPGLLHLKTGISHLGEGRLSAAEEVADLPALQRFERVVLDPAESYAANCIRVNDRVIVAAGYPRFEDQLDRLGYRPLALEMSEFRKMDGGLSCLSLRF